MNTIIQKVEKEHPDETVLKQAGEILKSGGLVAFPTETVYGLGGDGLNARSSEKIYAAKGRPSDNPLIVHIADTKDVYKLAFQIWKVSTELSVMCRKKPENWLRNIGRVLLL